MVITLLIATILFVSLSLLKTYKRIPLRELKRQARTGDKIAQLFYRPASYGMSLDILLWFIIGLSGSSIAVILSRTLPWPIAILLILLIIVFGFGWMPDTQLTRFGVKIAEFAAPGIHWVLDRCQPVLKSIGHLLKKSRAVAVHTGLFSKQDLLDLIDQQKIQIDNRITKDELYIAAHALTFGEKKVLEVMTPHSQMKGVAATELIGPVLMGELHDSGHSRFPVYQDEEKNIVGMLYLRDMLKAKAGGFVKSIMRPEVFYVHENEPLARVLDAFIKTKHHLFLVVNNFEEIVGVITIEDVVEQIVGKQIIDEFDTYEDIRAVAHIQAAKKHSKQDEAVSSELKADTADNEEAKDSKKPNKHKQQ